MSPAAAPMAAAAGDIDEPGPLRIDCDAQVGNLRPMLDLLDAQSRRAGVSANVQHDLRLMVEEACMNIIQHAHRASRGQGRLCLLWASVVHLGRPAVSITLEDDGRPFMPVTDLPAARGRAGAAPKSGGWGVPLIQRLSDVHCYRRQADGINSLRLIKYLESASPDRPGLDNPTASNES